MGTSGAYGGSGKQSWEDVHDLFNDLPPDSPGGGDADSDADPGLDALAAALADALAKDDPALAKPSQPFALSSFLPHRGGGGGAGGSSSGGSLRGESSAAGRSGGGSTRSVARSAARGGAAIGGAYAVQSGNADALRELGLDLDELRRLKPRAQCARILDAVLGEAGHPDEAALRAAAAEQLKAILMGGTPPAEGDALRGFIESFVFQMGLVELRSELASKSIDAVTASKKEGRLRRYLKVRVAALKVPESGRLTIAEFSAHADRLVRNAIDLLRAK